MKSDIVQRLRDWADTICTLNNHVPLSSKAKMAIDAADEIDRLRAELAAAKAELVRNADELAAAIKQRDEARELNKSWEQKAATWLATPEAIARLQSYRDLGQQVAEAHSKIDLLRAELAAMRHQRDEARRMWCRIISLTRRGAGEHFAPEAIAVEYGWDCFAQQEGGGA